MPYTVYYLIIPRKASVRWRSTRFYYDAMVKTMYHRSYDGILLLCLSNSKAREGLKEAQDGICGAHQLGPNLKNRLHLLSYYWPTMIVDAVQYVRRCKAWKIHADFIHQPSELLHLTVVSQPCEAWRIDVVGPISPSLVKGHLFIVAIIDYFQNGQKLHRS